jgi:hypothetical protein
MPATKPNAVPMPVRAREAITSPGSGAARASALVATMMRSPTNPTRRAPTASTALPAGICINAWTTKSAVVKRPTVASETP